MCGQLVAIGMDRTDCRFRYEVCRSRYSRYGQSVVREVTSYKYGQIVALGTNNLLLLVRVVTSYRYGQLVA